MRIDAHQHYWDPARGDYGWMPEDDPVLARCYGPADLEPSLRRHGIQGTVLVQAAPTVAETDYLLALADATPSVVAVVGWVDFENTAHREHLQRFVEHRKFVGVRPMIQDIADDRWMLREQLDWAYRALLELDLVFDALGFPRHLEHFLELGRRYPGLRMVLDHCMKPAIRDQDTDREAFSGWAAGMSRLAERTEACCKLSGLVTEAGEGWTLEDLRPYAEHVLDCFGPRRVMWGSDWPVCRLRTDYAGWLDAAKTLTAHLDQRDRDSIFGDTARGFYRIAS